MVGQETGVRSQNPVGIEHREKLADSLQQTAGSGQH
jgi:hypothetical protein